MERDAQCIQFELGLTKLSPPTDRGPDGDQPAVPRGVPQLHPVPVPVRRPGRRDHERHPHAAQPRRLRPAQDQGLLRNVSGDVLLWSVHDAWCVEYCGFQTLDRLRNQLMSAKTREGPILTSRGWPSFGGFQGLSSVVLLVPDPPLFAACTKTSVRREQALSTLVPVNKRRNKTINWASKIQLQYKTYSQSMQNKNRSPQVRKVGSVPRFHTSISSFCARGN